MANEKPNFTAPRRPNNPEMSILGIIAPNLPPSQIARRIRKATSPIDSPKRDGQFRTEAHRSPLKRPKSELEVPLSLRRETDEVIFKQHKDYILKMIEESKPGYQRHYNAEQINEHTRYIIDLFKSEFTTDSTGTNWELSGYTIDNDLSAFEKAFADLGLGVYGIGHGETLKTFNDRETENLRFSLDRLNDLPENNSFNIVVDKHFQPYLLPISSTKITTEKKHIKHSSVSVGKVIFAGSVKINKGNITISNRSGHFKVSPENFRKFAELLPENLKESIIFKVHPDKKAYRGVKALDEAYPLEICQKDIDSHILAKNITPEKIEEKDILHNPRVADATREVSGAVRIHNHRERIKLRAAMRERHPAKRLF